MTATDVLVSFPADGGELAGNLYRPEGEGEHPAIVWHHGSERDPDAARELGEFFAASGFVLFAPHRRGHGQSPGQYRLDEIKRQALARTASAAELRRQVITAVIDLHENQFADTAAALGWLRSRSFVAAGHVAMGGVSHGGIQSLLAAEADSGAVAYLPFAPGAMAWESNPELADRLGRAAEAACRPVFLVQAENDYSLGPATVLGAILRAKGPPNQCRVYPAYGSSPQAGHGDFACRATEVWGDDVLEFLGETLPAGLLSRRGGPGPEGARPGG